MRIVRFLRQPLGPTVEAVTGIAVVCFMIAFGTLGHLVQKSNVSIGASTVVLVWAGWMLRSNLEQLGVIRR